MSDTGRKGFDSSGNVSYIHQDKGGRQPPGGGELEARVTKLERIAEDTRSTLETIQRQLARMDTRLDALPTKGFVFTSICSIYGLMVATGALAVAAFALLK